MSISTSTSTSATTTTRETRGVLEIDDFHRLFALGDVHGDLPRLVAVLEAVGLITVDPREGLVRWAAPPGTVLVQVGDQLDSAPRDATSPTEWEPREDVVDLHVVEFMTSLADVAARSGSRVVSCLGNHEVMNLTGEFSYVSAHSLRATGGVAGRAALLAPGGAYARRHFLAREIAVRVGPFLFCHAGLLPWHVPVLGAARAELRRALAGDDPGAGVPELLRDPDGPLWTREVALGPAGPASARAVCRAFGARHMVVGHTVTPEPVWRGDMDILLLDTGVSRSIGGNAAYVLEYQHAGRARVLRVDVHSSQDHWRVDDVAAPSPAEEPFTYGACLD